MQHSRAAPRVRMRLWHHCTCPTLAPCKAQCANPSRNAAAHPRTGSTAMARGLTSSVSKRTCRSEPSSWALSILSRPLSVQKMARRRWSTASPSGLMSPAKGMNSQRFRNRWLLALSQGPDPKPRDGEVQSRRDPEL